VFRIKHWISCLASIELLDRYRTCIVWEMTILYACLTGLFDLNLMNWEYLNVMNWEYLNGKSRRLSNFCIRNSSFCSSVILIKTFIKCALTPNCGEVSENLDIYVFISIMSNGYIQNGLSIVMGCNGFRKILASPTLSQHIINVTKRVFKFGHNINLA
jgi:hypothetical protein